MKPKNERIALKNFGNVVKILNKKNRLKNEAANNNMKINYSAETSNSTSVSLPLPKSIFAL
jgi:hypothetical protein